MILEIDLGNTRIKWRLRDDSRRLASGAADRGELSRLGDELDALGHVPDEVWAASVLTDTSDAELSRWCRQRWNLEPRFAQTQAQCAGVINGYRDPLQLGVDRWLALVAARQVNMGPLLVVQAGTAVTVDLLGSDGVHLGGYIAPGWRLMRQALTRDTARVRPFLGPPEHFTMEPGRDTAEAVEAALSAMMLGLVQRAQDQLGAREEGRSQTLIAGGDGPLLQAYLPGALVKPELVLDGLAPVIGAQRARI